MFLDVFTLIDYLLIIALLEPLFSMMNQMLNTLEHTTRHIQKHIETTTKHIEHHIQTLHHVPVTKHTEHHIQVPHHVHITHPTTMHELVSWSQQYIEQINRALRETTTRQHVIHHVHTVKHHVVKLPIAVIYGPVMDQYIVIIDLTEAVKVVHGQGILADYYKKLCVESPYRTYHVTHIQFIDPLTHHIVKDTDLTYMWPFERSISCNANNAIYLCRDEGPPLHGTYIVRIYTEEGYILESEHPIHIQVRKIVA